MSKSVLGILHNARKEHLMKNKKLLSVLSLLLATSMILCGCDNSGKASSSASDSDIPSSSDSEGPKPKYMVNFVVDGVTTYSYEVEAGDFAYYPYANPTKDPDAESPKYRFKGWDKNIFLPITESTTFTAEFASYATEYVIDDFEGYVNTAELKDAGWQPITYGGNGWTTNTKATVSLGHKATQGNNSLRFDGWENDVGFKFAKELDCTQFTKSVNALQFSWMVPDINTISVLIYGTITASGQTVSAYFSNKFKPKSSEYVEYTIPLDDPNWALYGEAGKSIASVAEWSGIHQDDVISHINKIEFYMQGSNGGQPFVAFCDSIKFVTIDNSDRVEYEAMNNYSCYTGYDNEDNTVRIDINNDGTANLGIIDLETPINVSGTVTQNEDSFVFASTELTYIGKKVNAGKAVKCLSVSGDLAERMEGMELGSLQVVDNYEQYETDGQAYYEGHPKSDRSGCRGAYYSEYYSGSANDDTQWGGNKWSLMRGSGDQLKLMTDGGHTGSNYVSMKHSTTNAMRYMQWGLYDGTSHMNSFRGSSMGFWAKTTGPISNFKVYMYSQTNPENATKDSYVRAESFSAPSTISEWTHFEVSLDPSAVYYGFCVLIQPESDPESYLYMDDVEVYNANPYETYIPPEPLKVPTNVTYIGRANDLTSVTLEPRNATRGQLKVPSQSLTKNFTYTLNENELTINFTLPTASYKGTLADDQSTITFKSMSGSGQIYDLINGLSFQMIEYADNAESYTESGTMYYQGNKNEKRRSGARGAYYCEYEYSTGNTPVGGPGWLLMGGNGDQLDLDTTDRQDFSKSLKMKASSNGRMRYMQWNLYKGKGSDGHTGFNRFGFYLLNSNEKEISLTVSVYYAKKVTMNNVTSACVNKKITLANNSPWTFYQIELDPTVTYYGYSVVFDKLDSSSYYVNVDRAFYFNDFDHPDAYFFTKKDLTLTGSVTAGAATLKFDDNGVVKFTCADAGINNVSYTYSIRMSGTTEQMIIKINEETSVTGSYSVSTDGKVTFTVTAVEGTSTFNVGASFTYQP